MPSWGPSHSEHSSPIPSGRAGQTRASTVGRDSCRVVAELSSDVDSVCHLRACDYLIELPGAFANQRRESSLSLVPPRATARSSRHMSKPRESLNTSISPSLFASSAASSWLGVMMHRVSRYVSSIHVQADPASLPERAERVWCPKRLPESDKHTWQGVCAASELVV
jgi:hypothetical protein